jgi:hypothetical protein
MLLGGDRDIGDCTAAVARQRSANNTGMVFSAWSAKKQLNGNRGTVFYVRSVLSCYKQDIWSNELVVGQSIAAKNVSTEAEDIVRIREEATTGEDIADLEELINAVVNWRVCKLAIAL